MWVAAAKRGEGVRGMSSEAAAHLVRHLAERPDQRRVVGELVVALDARVTRIAARWTRGLDETTKEEIAIEVGQSIMELLLGPRTERADILESLFLTAVKTRVLDAIDKRRRQAKPHEVAVAERKRANPKKYETPEEAFGIDDETEEAIDPETRLIEAESAVDAGDAIRKALDHVKNPKHREAVVLHHLRGWPITDQDPATDTLCKRFGVGDRQIREWIATAFAQMRRAIGETS
jgi:DNA-directed RNA polymerase specialized sigma24 family protein